MIGLRTVVETTHARGWIRDMDVRLKLAMLAAAAVLVILIDAPWTLLGLLCLVAAVYASAGLPAAKLRLVVFVALLTVWGTMLSQALFYASVPRTVLFELIPRDCPVLGDVTGGLTVTREGLVYGAVQSMRIVTMIGLGLLVCWTTDAGSFLAALVRLRVPYGVAFRGWLRPWGWVSVFKPVFANAIRRSRALALSVASRGFDASGERTALRRTHLSVVGAVLCVVLGVVLAAVAAMKLLHWMFMEEVYYADGLWWVYDLVRTVL